MKYFLSILTLFIMSSYAIGDDVKKNCYPITGKDLIRSNAPKFTDYPAVVKKISKPAKVKLDSPAARMWRTMIREGAKNGPRFAGHYAIAEWGCGSDCTEFVLIDLVTGKVIYPEGIDPITYNTPLIDADDYETENMHSVFRVRNDSRLLIVVAAIDDEFANRDRIGAFYYVLENNKLKKIFETKVWKDNCFKEYDGEPWPHWKSPENGKTENVISNEKSTPDRKAVR